MSGDVQRAIITYCCARGFVNVLEERLEAGIDADYLPLSLFLSTKIVEHCLYDRWDFVLETLEACNELFRGSKLERLVRNARFTAWMLNVFIALKFFNPKYALSTLYIKSTILFLVNDFKKSQNADNVRLALHVERTFTQFFKNKYSRRQFLENTSTTFEPTRRRLYVLLDAVRDLITESYLTHYERLLPRFVRPTDGAGGPDESTLADRLQLADRRAVTDALLSLNNVIVLESQPSLAITTQACSSNFFLGV